MDFDTIVNNIIDEWNVPYLRTKIERWVNKANERVNRFHPYEYLIVPTTLDVVAGDKTATMPVDFDSPRLISIGYNEKPLTVYYSYKEFKRDYPSISSLGIPDTVSILNDTLYFNKKLDQDITLDIDYCKKTTKLVNTDDVPEAPEKYHSIIELGGLWQLEKYLSLSEWQATRQDFERGMLQMKLELTENPISIPKMGLPSSLIRRRQERLNAL